MVLYGAVTVPRLTTHCRKTVGSRDVHSAHTEMVKITVPIRMLKNGKSPFNSTWRMHRYFTTDYLLDTLEILGKLHGEET